MVIHDPHFCTALCCGTMQESLQALALEQGFDVVGFAPSHTPITAIQQYQHWLDAGKHAGMDYLERQLPRRANLKGSLPEVKSVMVLGISHAFAPPEKPKSGLRVGKVAKYAWTQDYHSQIEPKLRILEQHAKSLGIHAKGYVDYGPVMERMVAAQGFLGWRGKSGMLVSTGLGAFLTLAVVLLSLPVEPAPPHPDRCGRCTACIKACPTGAIETGRVLDAAKCISYLTIEHKGSIPWQWRSAIGEWLFGCDGCLEVCPWSIKAGSIAQHFIPQPELTYPDVWQFLNVSNREFERRFAGSAFVRAGRKSMARNACMVLGNTKHDDHVPWLKTALQDEAWQVREAAVWGLGQYEAKWVENALKDSHPAVAQAAQHILQFR